MVLRVQKVRNPSNQSVLAVTVALFRVLPTLGGCTRHLPAAPGTHEKTKLQLIHLKMQ
jgi:hypothetical protein